MNRALFLFLSVFLFFSSCLEAQVKWENVDVQFAPLPTGIHVYRTDDPIDGKPNIAYYVEADLSIKNLEFTTDTSLGRRLTPSEFYQKNQQPVLVVNTTFFSFATNQNLNVVIQNGKLLGYNIHSLPARGKDTFTYRHPYASAIGISKKRKADVAWIYTDSSRKLPYAMQFAPKLSRDSLPYLSFDSVKFHSSLNKDAKPGLSQWKMKTAVGGGPVLVQEGEIKISNNEEWRFPGKAIDDKHPRTAMGYTSSGNLVIMVVEGRNPGKAEGVSLVQLAQLFKDIGCYEALNLDGGGSSCMLINGKETIKVSDAAGQRPVPSVFIIRSSK